MDRLWLDFQKTLEPEVTEKLAKVFVERLLEKSNGDICAAEEIYFKIGKLWAPTIVCWRNWILRNAKANPILVRSRIKIVAAGLVKQAYLRGPRRNIGR